MDSLLEGSSVAVDGAVWLHEAQLQRDVLLAYGARRAALKVVFERCSRWLRKGVLPVLVLEGVGGGRAERLARGGRRKNAGLSPILAMQKEVVELLSALGVPCIKAEGEAEAECATLGACSECDFVATTDFDALLFGAPRVLRRLDLRLEASASRCELWEAAVIEGVLGLDRGALAAGAFLIGCEYDIRKCTADPSQARAPGIARVGPRRALGAVISLRQGQGDVLGSLGALLAGSSTTLGEKAAATQGKKIVGEKARRRHGAQECAQCGTSSGCLPQRDTGEPCSCARCSHIASLGGKAAALAAGNLAQVLRRVVSEPDASSGLRAVVQQYGRSQTLAASVDSGASTKEESEIQTSKRSFTWEVVDEMKALSLLSSVFSKDPAVKLLPLLLERTLRTVVAECPCEQLETPEGRRSWAVTRGLQWSPVSATRPVAPSWYAVVAWEPCLPSARSLHSLPEAGRKARLRLVWRCALLGEDARRPLKLRAALRDMAERCPPEVRGDPQSLRAWARNRAWSLAPCGVDVGHSRKRQHVQVVWEDTRSGRKIPGLTLAVPHETAESFGQPLTCSNTPQQQRQRSLAEFFESARASSAADPDPLTQEAATASTPDAAVAPSTPQRGVPRRLLKRQSTGTPPRRLVARRVDSDTKAKEVTMISAEAASRQSSGPVAEASIEATDRKRPRWRAGLLQRGPGAVLPDRWPAGVLRAVPPINVE